MKKLVLLFFFFLSLSLHAIEKNSSFVVVIPSYNNQEWYKRNLDSVFSQSFQHFRVIYIDDASPDGTGRYVREYLERHGLQDRVTLIQNEKRVGALANIYRAVWSCSPHEIVVNLDGDDWFAHRDVLAQLNKVYKDSSVWLTYGQFIYYPSYLHGIGCEIPQDVIEHNAFRTFTRGTTALRTFYAGLFHHIKREDLQNEGAFFQTGYDLAIMLPMLEMAGSHSRFIPEVSYVYNFNTPINDHKVHFEEQAKVDVLLRKKEKYTPLYHYNQKDPPKRIYITPGYWGQLFAADNPIFNRDNCLDVLYQLRAFALEKGYDLQQADSLDSLENFEYLIVFEIFPDQLPDLAKYPKEKLLLFLWEPPSILPDNYNPDYHHYFSKIYTWNDDLVDNEKYFKFYYPVLRPMVHPTEFYLKRFSTMIACNKESSYPGELYSERDKIVHFFENFPNDDFDLYGKRWPNSYKSYQGPIETKVNCLRFYKFSFAYENVRGVPGYVSEKIFDCFHAGTVPIYWGAPNICSYIPENCFIAREDFEDERALYEFLKAMTPQEYGEYMENIQKFLTSDAAQLYSIENFIRIFMDLIGTEE